MQTSPEIQREQFVAIADIAFWHTAESELFLKEGLGDILGAVLCATEVAGEPVCDCELTL